MLIAIFLITTILTLLSTQAVSITTNSARSHLPRYPSPQLLARSAVDDSYIVVLRPTAKRPSIQAARLAGLKATHVRGTFEIGDFRGYEAKVTSNDVLEVLEQSPDVAYIVPNRIVTTAHIRDPDPQRLLSSHLTNRSSLWNHGRISHRSVGPYFNYRYSSLYDTKNCTNYAYIIDSGLYLAHDEFEGRAKFGVNTVGGEDIDGTGHGTHIAGILAGKTFGIAKKTHLIAVKVLDSEGFGTYASLLHGIEWAVKHAIGNGRLGVSVINMSLVGAKERALNDASRAAVKAGLPVVVAAGNFGDLAINYSPASEREVLTVGASNINDERPFWSNYGIMLDFFAPGEDILSSYNLGPNSTALISGTSMAAAHVSGLVNYLQCVLGVTHPRIIREKLGQLASVGLIQNSGNTTPNRLIYNGSGQ